MDIQKRLELVNLASLLHDIGEFSQRAGGGATQGMEQEDCPHGFSHAHVLYTNFFIEHELPLPPELVGERSRIARMATVHHRPDSNSAEEMSICEADRLSSGGEPLEGKSQDTKTTARLESLFTSVGLGTCAEGPVLRYPLAALDDPDTPLFPRTLEEAGKGTYAALYMRFCEALRRIPLDMGVRHYIHSLTTVLERFTWCIPSSTWKTRADISLFDHAYTTASIAQALYVCSREHAKPGLLLFGGELGGIQKYIFGEGREGDRGAGKLLRARSFILQMLTRSIWRDLLDKTGLGGVARIMDAGGRFVLLLPDIPAVHKATEALQARVNTWLLQNGYGTLRIYCTTLDLCPEDLERTRFQACFERFNDQLEAVRLHPFAEHFREGLSPVLPVDFGAYGAHGECSACHRQPACVEQEEGTWICKACDMLIRQVGRRLPSAHYAVLSRTGEGYPLFGGLSVRLGDMSAADRSASDSINLRGLDDFSGVPVAGYVPEVSAEDMARWAAEGRLTHNSGRALFAGEPVAVGQPKTFSVLAEEARVPIKGGGYRSVACLGACKADVDNLGLLFSIGFGTGKESTFSISRFAMLSRMLNHFFAAHLIRVIRQEFPAMYVVFAGGDDLFVLGPWSEAVRFARRLHADFMRFSGGNPHVSLSAGVPVVKPSLPVRALRQAAEEALERAKGFPGKCAVQLFEEITSWSDFEAHMQTAEQLEQLCLDGEVSQGLVRRLLGYSRECRAFIKGDVSKGLYLSHMMYDLARMQAEKRLKPVHANWLCGLGHDERRFQHEQASITWALYRTRRS